MRRFVEGDVNTGLTYQLERGEEQPDFLTSVFTPDE